MSVYLIIHNKEQTVCHLRGVDLERLEARAQAATLLGDDHFAVWEEEEEEEEERHRGQRLAWGEPHLSQSCRTENTKLSRRGFTAAFTVEKKEEDLSKIEK